MTTKRTKAQVDNAGEFLSVAIDLIDPDPENERHSMRNVDELASSIRLVGMIEPITVSQNGDRFTVRTGHRRLEAAKRAGLTTLEVIVREQEHEVERRRKSLVSNVQREDLNPIDLAEAVQALYADGEEFGTQRSFAAAIGKSESWVSDIMAITHLPSELREKLRISVKPLAYDSVSRIARLEDISEQSKLVEQLLNGASNQAVRKSTGAGSKPERVVRESVRLDDYRAVVTGPNDDAAHARMVEAVKALLEKLLADNQSPATA